jgi:glycosyltransferase involved in cell wall biosynthesis
VSEAGAPTSRPGGIRLSVVVPVYNERDNVEELVARIDAAAAPLGPHEVILVDDGSRDGSGALYPALCARFPALRVLELRRNYGQSAALTAGFQHARGELVATLDGDLQNDPGDLPVMVARLEGEGCDLVCGWRKHRKDPGFSRKMPSLVANRLIAWMTDVRLHDYGCALRVFRGEIVRGMILYGELHRFIPVLASLEGARIVEMEVRHHPRTRGVSKYGWGRLPRVVLDLVLMRFFQRFATRPLQFFGAVGSAFATAGGLVLAYLLWVKFGLGENIGERPLLLVGVMLALMGFVGIAVGIVAELVVRAQYEPAGRRIYRVRRDLGGPR